MIYLHSCPDSHFPPTRHGEKGRKEERSGSNDDNSNSNTKNSDEDGNNVNTRNEDVIDKEIHQ